MSASLFIGGLSWGTSESALSTHLGAVAPVEHVSIPKDRMSGKSRGFAFATMQSSDGAARVVAELNGKELDGRFLRISEARPEESEPRRLFVAGLPPSVTESQLHDHLSKAGAIERTSIVTDREHGHSRGFAFVDTVTESDATTIIASCNGSTLSGAQILVRASKRKPEESSRRHR